MYKIGKLLQSKLFCTSLTLLTSVYVIINLMILAGGMRLAISLVSTGRFGVKLILP